MSDTPENINNEEEEFKEEPEELIPETSDTAEEIPEQSEEIIPEQEEKISEGEASQPIAESNYQISLVNENLLKIVLKTDKSVGVDCFVKDKTESKTDPAQTNRITIHPTADGRQHEIEIIVSISPEGEVTVTKVQSAGEEAAPKAETAPVKKKLLIDPAFTDLVEKQTKLDSAAKNVPQTWNDFFQERLSSKNKYNVNRRILEKNLKTGFIISVLFFFTWAFITFGVTSSKKNTQEEAPEVRLLTIEDLPEMKVDVPLTEKQKQELEDKDGTGNTSAPSKITLPSRKVLRTPKIVTQKDTLPGDTNIAMTNEELDKQRRGGDTTGNGSFGISGVYDSTKVYIDVMQAGWTLIDSSNVNKMQLSLFSNDSIATYIDPKVELKDFNFQVKKRGVNGQAELDKAVKNGRPFKDFILNDPAYKGYVTLGPKSGAGTVEYDFMIKNDKVAISILTFTADGLFPQYQPKIEAVIKSIKLPTK
ncbi:MAG TPA: hypothetical protein PK447_02455 [Ignavibacteria bacterium]|nr:hypothetical protein [Ignavibacteria bacterium]